jgi:hypothetical protein
MSYRERTNQKEAEETERTEIMLRFTAIVEIFFLKTSNV